MVPKSLYLFLLIFIFGGSHVVASGSTVIKVASSRKASEHNDMHAQVSVEREELLLFFEEEDLIVTATKHPQTLKEAPAIATIITAKQIKNMGARSLIDAIKMAPGIWITKGFTGKYQIEVRGIVNFNSNNVKFLMDGLSLNDNFFGSFEYFYSNLSLDNVKRIEILRGPGSALYGSNAFSAVVNIITKTGADIDGVIITGGGGSFNTGRANLQAGKSFDELDIAFHLDYLTTDGPAEFVRQDAVGRPGYTDEGELKVEAGIKASYKDFTFHSNYVRRDRNPYIGVGNALNKGSELEFEKYYAELIFKHQLTESLDITVKGNHDQIYFDTLWVIIPENVIPAFPDGMIGNPYFSERSTGSEIQLDYQVSTDNFLTVGFTSEYSEEYNVGSTTNFNPLTGAPLGSLQDVTDWGNFNKDSNRTVNAVYVQDIWNVSDSVTTTLGVRHDDYSDVGGFTSPRIVAIWKFLEYWDLKLMYGRAFRAPSMTELYTKNNPVSLGNPALKAEEMTTYEASVGYRNGDRINGRLVYFQNIFDEKISTVSNPVAPGSFQYENSGGAKVHGIEAEVRTEFVEDLQFYANYTYQSAEDSDSGDKLPNVADHKGNVGFNAFLSGKLNVNMNVFMTDELTRSANDDRDPVPGYALVDLAVTLKNFYKTFEVRASAHNLFDKKYFDPSAANTVPGDFPRDGASYMIEIEYKL